MMKLEVSEKEQVWSALSEPSDLVPHPDYGDLYSLHEFVDMLQCGAITPDDGCGAWATAARYDQTTDISLRRTLAKKDPRPGWATHVLWFNK
jgi:hypothetical protein